MIIKELRTATLSTLILLLAVPAWADDMRFLPVPRLSGSPHPTAPLAIQPRPQFRRPLPQHSFNNRIYYGTRSWRAGMWRHEDRGGRYGWWWNTGGIAYFYSAPSEGAPDYVSDISEPDAPGQPAGPAPPAPPQRAYLYLPADMNGAPYDTLEACWDAQKKAGKGICVLK